MQDRTVNLDAMPETKVNVAAPEVASRKRKSAGTADSQDIDPSSRCQLHEALRAILRRDLQVGDVVYEVAEAGGGQVAEVRLLSLPGEWSRRTWTGVACAKRQLAKSSAADAALQSMMADAELAAQIRQPADFAANQEGLRESVAQSALVPLRGPAAQQGDAPLAFGGQKGSVPTSVKTQLIIFCQRSCGRPMRREDVVYTTLRAGVKHVATVRLNCFEGEEFRGEPRPDRRQAEQAAAEVALQGKARERAQLCPASAKRRRLQRDAEMAKRAPAGSKMRLHEACTMILGRSPQAGDVVYEVVAGNSGPSATLRLPCLQGGLGSQVWTSAPCASRHDARSEAAALALRAIWEDPDLGRLCR